MGFISSIDRTGAIRPDARRRNRVVTLRPPAGHARSQGAPPGRTVDVQLEAEHESAQAKVLERKWLRFLLVHGEEYSFNACADLVTAFCDVRVIPPVCLSSWGAFYIKKGEFNRDTRRIRDFTVFEFKYSRLTTPGIPLGGRQN